MENPEPRAQYLNVVLRQIERTSLRIPRFQRHFVWGERDVLDLLGSIENGYPIGSILTWRVDAASGYFSGFRQDPFPPADTSVPNFEVILDGAQRLSSLYGCLRHPSTNPVYKVYYDARDASFVHARDVHQPRAWHVPMDTLFDSRRFLSVQAEMAADPEGDTYLQRALSLYETFQDYQIPIIALASAVLEDVVEVFRRVNSSGTPLSPVDFVRALTWRSSFDLEETFAEFAERYQGTPLEGLTEDFLIKCLAIAAGLSLDARDILQLKDMATRPEALSEEVEAMQRGLDRMAAFLERFDIAGMQEVPYEVQRLLLFAMMHFQNTVDELAIEAWLWRSTFAEEHQSKPESYVSRLVRAMQAGHAEEALDVRKPIDSSLFATRVRRAGSAVATGFDLVLRRTAARSLLSGDPATGADALHGTLFGRGELSADPVAPGSTQVLGNLVLLTRDDASEWKILRERKSLTELYGECQDRTGEAEAIWKSQALDGDDLEADPGEVLMRRSTSLIDAVLPGFRAL